MSKANLFFLLGSLFYLPPAVKDLDEAYRLDESSGDYNHNDKESSERTWADTTSTALVLLATVFYFLNGILEIRVAWKEHVKNQVHLILIHKDSTKNLLNGGLFAVAALFEIASVLWHQKEIVLLLISTHIYLLNALFTIWINRNLDSNNPTADRMIHAGDGLFLMGVLIDIGGCYLEMEDVDVSERVLAWCWMASALAWFLDALLYLGADYLTFKKKWMPKRSQALLKPSPSRDLQGAPSMTSTTSMTSSSAAATNELAYCVMGYNEASPSSTTGMV